MSVYFNVRFKDGYLLSVAVWGCECMCALLLGKGVFGFYLFCLLLFLYDSLFGCCIRLPYIVILAIVITIL